MARLVGVDLPRDKRIEIALTYIYGIGRSRSAEILAASQPTLDRAIAVLRNLTANVRIEGHTDSTGNAAANQTLSEQRANAVRNYLIAGGISANRLTAVGVGQDRPIADNNTDEGRSRNRRIEFAVG